MTEREATILANKRNALRHCGGNNWAVLREGNEYVVRGVYPQPATSGSRSAPVATSNQREPLK